jgi:hypothetical protein
MESMNKRVWGYKKGGEACLFELADGAMLPAGWSEDYHIIEKLEHQTAEHITEAAGLSAEHPVKVAATGEASVEHPSSEAFPLDFRREPTARQEAIKPELDEPKRVPGRPPLSKG